MIVIQVQDKLDDNIHTITNGNENLDALIGYQVTGYKPQLSFY
jgi:hypothetical protein